MPTDCSRAASGPEAGHLEDARREVEHRVDAGELVEERDQDGEQDRHAQASGPEMRRRDLFRGSGGNLVRVGFDVRRRRARVRFAAARPMPPRGRLCGRSASAGFPEGRSTSRCRGWTGRRRLPSIQRQAFSPIPASSALDTKAMTMPKTMLNWNMPASRPRCRRRDFRDVERGGDGGDADAQPADEAGGDERDDAGGQAAADAPTRYRTPIQSSVALRPKRSVGQPPEQRPDHGAVERRGHRHAVHARRSGPRATGSSVPRRK